MFLLLLSAHSLCFERCMDFCWGCLQQVVIILASLTCTCSFPFVFGFCHTVDEDLLHLCRMFVVFLRGVLTDCLNLDGHPLIWISALQLFAQLVRAASNLPAICSKSGEQCSPSFSTFLLLLHVLSMAECCWRAYNDCSKFYSVMHFF